MRRILIALALVGWPLAAAAQETFIVDKVVITSNAETALQVTGVSVLPQIVLTPGSQPSTATEGKIYYDSTAHTVKYYNGTAWGGLGAVSSVTGTSNQITCSPTTGAVICGTPQNIHSGASPTFAGLNITGTSFVLQSGGVTGTIVWAPSTSNKTITLPNGTTDFTATGGTSQVVKQTSAGGAFTVAQLAASDLSNGTTGSGAIVLANTPTLITPVLGVATATTINKVTITAPASGSTLTIADGSSLITSGAFAGTFTFTGTTGVTFPTSGTLATLAGAESLTNKKLGSLTSNGFVKTSGGDGTLSVDTSTYLTTAVTSATGTANQITVSAATGAVTFSTPQDIATGSTPQFARMGIGAAAGSTAKLTILGGGIVAPSADSTAALIISKADASTSVLTIDTTNSRLVVPNSNSAPILTGGTSTTGIGFTTNGGNGLVYIASGTSVYYWSGSSMIANQGVVLSWGNNATATSATADTGFARNGAGIVEVNNGSAGTFRDLKARSIGLNVAPTGTNGQLAMSSTVTTYNNIATQGLGVPPLYEAPAVSATKTGNFTVWSYTPPSAAGVYEVEGVITSTSSTNTGTVQLTLDYVDSQGATHTGDIIFICGANAACAATQTGASKEWHSQPWLFSINNAGTAIVLKVVTSGSVSYTVTGTLTQVQ